MTGPTGQRPAGIPPETSPREDEIRLIDYWHVLVARRRIVIACLVVSLVVGVVYSLIASPLYQATTTLQIERRAPGILTYQEVMSVDPSGYQDFYQTQYKILQSHAVLGLAAERLDLVNRPEFANRRRSPARRIVDWLGQSSGTEPDDPAHEALAFLEDHLSVNPVRNSHLVRISFTGRDPLLARDVADALASAYQEFSLASRYSATAQASEFLTKQVMQLQAQIAKKEQTLQEYSARKEILSLRDETHDITSQALADMSAEYVRARGRLAVARARYDSLREAPTDALHEVLQSPLINSLRQQHADLERRYRQMSERFGDDWPALRQLAQELDQSRTRLQLESDGIAHQVRGGARTDYERALAEVEGFARRVDELKQEVRRVNFDAIEVTSLQAEIETERRFLEDLVSRQNQTLVSDRLRDTQASNIRMVDRAELPEEPIRPRKLFNLAFSAIFGLLLGIVGAFFVHHLDNTVKSESDIEQIARIPVFGYIPMYQPLRAVEDATLPAGASVDDPIGVASFLDPRSVFAEAFKNLRTSLLLASPDHPPRLIVVTSCEPGDGKSTISVNLAVVLTQMGRRVLLVDADLRRPRLHRILGLENRAGLSNLMTGNAELSQILRETHVDGLTVVTSGPIPPNPSELLGSTALHETLAYLGDRGSFDHVIFDSPPTVQVADSVILAARTDATVVVVRAGKTARESLAQGVARLRQARVHVAGAVLNAVAEHRGYHYGGYRTRGYTTDGAAVDAAERDLGRPRKRSRSA